MCTIGSFVPAKRSWLLIQLAFTAAVIWYFGLKVAHQWAELDLLRGEIHPGWWRVAGSGILVFGSYAVLIETWRRTVIAWGARLRFADAARIWFISNLGRYLPGKIWQIGAMGALASQAGVSGVAAMGSSLVVNVVNVVAACLVISLAGFAHLAGPQLLPLLSIVLLAMFTVPWILPGLVRLAGRITGRTLLAPTIPPTSILIALFGCAAAWVLYGIAFEQLDIALFGSSAGTTASYTAVFTLSYLVGYLTFVPGGIGVREVSLTALLAAAGLETDARASVLVIASRLWLVVLEAAPGLLLLALRGVGKHMASDHHHVVSE